MTNRNSYKLTPSERKQRVKEEKKLEALRAERRKELERLVREEDSRRRMRRRLASVA